MIVYQIFLIALGGALVIEGIRMDRSLKRDNQNAALAAILAGIAVLIVGFAAPVVPLPFSR